MFPSAVILAKVLPIDTCLMYVLLDASVNVTVGEKEERMMITGLHTVVDIFCVGCGSIVGWKYVSSCHENLNHALCFLSFFYLHCL